MADETSIKTESKDTESIDDNYFPIKVFCRIRPLIKDEIESKHEMMKWECIETAESKETKENNDTKNPTKTSIILHNVNTADEQKKSSIKKTAKKSTKNNKNNKNSTNKAANSTSKQLKYVGFDSILTPEDDNKATFAKCLLPSLSTMFDGKTLCCFAYGHTGSGKTHTMLGKYNRDADSSNGSNVAGMFELTANYLFDRLAEINNTIEDSDDKVMIEMQFAEVYKNKIRDLFATNSDATECFVREGSDGFVLRGPTIKDEATGKVKVTTLTSIDAYDTSEVIKHVKDALLRRNVGNSTLHDESSRSHAFLSFEFINKKIFSARIECMEKESDVVPYGKQRDDMKIEVAMSGAVQYKQNPETKEYYKDESYVPNEEQQALLDKLDALETKVAELEGIHKKALEKLDDIFKNGGKYLGGTILFVDLAGNEYGSDVFSAKKGVSKQEMREMKDINKSLLALKECIRKLHDKEGHIPFRDSIITKVLKKHLIGDKSNGIMIANLSSSQTHIKKTVNTLKYTQLVGIA